MNRTNTTHILVEGRHFCPIVGTSRVDVTIYAILPVPEKDNTHRLDIKPILLNVETAIVQGFGFDLFIGSAYLNPHYYPRSVLGYPGYGLGVSSREVDTLNLIEELRKCEPQAVKIAPVSPGKARHVRK